MKEVNHIESEKKADDAVPPRPLGPPHPIASSKALDREITCSMTLL